jgi:hypothetical protein
MNFLRLLLSKNSMKNYNDLTQNGESHGFTLRYAILYYTVLYYTILCYNSLPRKSIAKMIKTEKSRDTTNPMNDCCSLSVFNIFHAVQVLCIPLYPYLLTVFPSILHYIFHEIFIFWIQTQECSQ